MLRTLNYLQSQRLQKGTKPWLEELFPRQLAFHDDPAKRKAWLGTRRAGKTTSNRAELVDALMAHPERWALYITLTGKTSHDNLWLPLIEGNNRWGLGLDAKLGEGRLVHPSGGFIWLAGCKDKREAEKFRGHAYSLVIIDEGGTHRTEVLEYLINDVLAAALSDHDAPLILTGTPGPIPSGYFWAATSGDDPDIKQWSTHHGSVLDNPYHPFGQEPEALDRHRQELGLAADDPTWLREWRGQWCLDESAIVYFYDAGKNEWDGTFPEGRKRTILGIDVGYNDDTAFTVTSSIHGQSTVYVEESYGKPELLTMHMAAEIRRLQERYTINEIYVDSGGLGKTIMMELREYGLPVLPAEKTDKAASINRVKAALAAGTLKINPHKCRELLSEWQVLPWNPEHTNHHAGFVDHRSDCLLYAHRKHPIYDQWIKDDPTPGSYEAALKWSAEQKARLIASAHRRRR